MSNAQPFFLKSRNCWCINVYVNGMRVRRKLSENKTEAFEIWKASLRARRETAVGNPLFKTISAQWLQRQVQRFDDGEVSADWLERVARTIASFNKAHPSKCCLDVQPPVLYEWLAGKSANYRRTEYSGIRQCLTWAFKNKLIAEDPLVALEMPAMQSRGTLLTLEQHRSLCRASDHVFKPLMRMSWLVGSRPGELRLLKWSHVTEDFSRAILHEHKTAKKKRKPRVIYFPPRAQALLRRLHRDRRGSEFVYINSRGKPWTRNAIVQRMDQLSEDTGIKAVAYEYRHAWITRALESGMAVAVVAELTGTSIAMVSRVYSKLGKKDELLATAAASIKDV